MVTETDRLRYALDVAARLYPECGGNRSALLRRLLDQGIDSVLEHESVIVDSRVGSLEELSRQMTDVWPEGWRNERLAEWPE